MPSREAPEPDPIEIAQRALAAINAGQTQKGLALALVSIALQLPEAQRSAKSLAGSLEDNAPAYRRLAQALNRDR
ncbi:hypothetical protein ND748_01005 [Frankia sp. AiPs1]|uniref:hypothetical protein n=1 Tax=Frankia sp. AiPs1 TaxID=573493 RepID=UPI0020439985|nr:hypothetical protein [Frankia sp. AiPs1]MCM3920268.1 hypothetical protein [Frankia sp. AiPs1]